MDNFVSLHFKDNLWQYKGRWGSSNLTQFLHWLEKWGRKIFVDRIFFSYFPCEETRNICVDLCGIVFLNRQLL
jgi:hypothetical protein